MPVSTSISGLFWLLYRVALSSCCAAALCGAAQAETLSPADYQAEKKRLATQDREAQAQCRAQDSAARQPCLTQAKTRDREARAALEARQRPATAATPAQRGGETTIRAGQYGHVTREGRATVGKAGDMPAASAAATRSAEELRKSKLPSNQPVDVVKAAREAKAAKP